jgi:hypothetical protein
MRENKLTTALVRSAYLFAMYTGIRAVANRVLSLFLPVPRAAVIDGAIIQLDETVSIKVRVHGKIRPSTTDAARAGGMISVYLVHPGIRRSLYSLLRVSSHFGCGHIELAFYEDDCTVCVFAVRNIMRSNLDRIGCNVWFRSLSLSTERDEILVLAGILKELRTQDLNVYLASPAECVGLAVSQWLLRPRMRARAITALTRKYERIASQIAMHGIPLHTEPRAARSLNQRCSPQPDKSRRYLDESSLLQLPFMVFTRMVYRLKTFLLQLFLVSTAFGLITTYGEHRYGLFAYIAVSALYSVGFAMYLSRSASTRNGIAGAVLGLAVALLFGVVPDFCCYVVPGGVEPTFDGDGPLIGLAILPLFAFFYLLMPIVMLGGFIGWTSSSIRSAIWSQGASSP